MTDELKPPQAGESLDPSAPAYITPELALTPEEHAAAMAEARRLRALEVATEKLNKERARVKEAVAKSRAEAREAKKAKEPEETISEMWLRNSRKLFRDDLAAYNKLQALHDAIEEDEAEVAEIVAGVKAGLRAETRYQTTKDSTEIFPMPDDSYRDIKARIKKEGVLNYRALENATTTTADGTKVACFRPAKGEKYDGTPESAYRFYGFRLKLGVDALRDIVDAYCIYAMRTRDANLDQSLLEEAIKLRQLGMGWHQNDKEFRELLAEFRKQPMTEQELIQAAVQETLKIPNREFM